MCPITDVLIVKNEQESIDSLTSMSYELVNAPADANIDWAILISKEFDGHPISDFQLGVRPSCQGKLVGDGAQQQLDFASYQVYGGETDECKKYDSYQPLSSSIKFNEYDMLERAGVWKMYESLTKKEKKVNDLKKAKKDTQLQLFKRSHSSKSGCIKELTVEGVQDHIDKLEELNDDYSKLKFIKP